MRSGRAIATIAQGRAVEGGGEEGGGEEKEEEKEGWRHSTG